MGEPVGIGDRMIPGLTPEPWVRDALCAQTDPDAFFPEKGEGDNARSARRVCMHCSVQLECLEYAIRTHQEHGMWGGMSPKQRRRVIRG